MTTNLLFIAQSGFAVVTAVYLALFIKEIRGGIKNTSWEPPRKKRYIRLVTGTLILWMALVSLWSLTGKMADFSRFPFNFLPVIGPALLTSIILLFSKSWSDILRAIPIHRFIRLQHFRVFVELLLWMLFAASFIPVQMTFEGRNFDVLAGITAPLAAWLFLRGKISNKILIVWNIFGLALLINIIGIAILSTPSPIRYFMNEPSSLIVAQFPVSWLPGFLAPLAFALHVFSLKQLRMNVHSGTPVSNHA
jgi:hypothetical protein